jgi:hypothetical protein
MIRLKLPRLAMVTTPMVERPRVTDEEERYGFWHPEVEDPSSLGDPREVVRILADMRADLIPIAELAGISVPSITAGRDIFEAFVQQLPDAQVWEALAVMRRANERVVRHRADLAAMSSGKRRGDEEVTGHDQRNTGSDHAPGTGTGTGHAAAGGTADRQ